MTLFKSFVCSGNSFTTLSTAKEAVVLITTVGSGRGDGSSDSGLPAVLTRTASLYELAQDRFLTTPHCRNTDSYEKGVAHGVKRVGKMCSLKGFGRTIIDEVKKTYL